MLATVLYAWLAIWTPLRALTAAPYAADGVAPWTRIGRRAAVGAAMLAMLWLEGWIGGHLIMARWAGGARRAIQDSSATSTADVVAWTTLLTPLALIAAIALLLHVMRVRAEPPKRRPGP